MQKYLFGLCIIVGLSILSYPLTDVSAVQSGLVLAAGQSGQVQTLSGGQPITMYIVNNHPTLAQFVPYTDSAGIAYECEGSSWLHHISNWLVSMLPTMWTQSRGLSVSCAGVPPVVLPPEPPQSICVYGGSGPDRFYFDPITATGNKAYLTYEVQYYHPTYSGGWQTTSFIDNVNTVALISDGYGQTTLASSYSGLIDGTLPSTAGFSCNAFGNGAGSGGTLCYRNTPFEYSAELSFLPSTGKNALSGTYPSLWFSDLSLHKDGFVQPIRIRAYSGTVAQDRSICDPSVEEEFWGNFSQDSEYGPSSRDGNYIVHPNDISYDSDLPRTFDGPNPSDGLGRSLFQVPTIPGEIRIIHDNLIQVNTSVNGLDTIMDITINSGFMMESPAYDRLGNAQSGVNAWFGLPFNNVIEGKNIYDQYYSHGAGPNFLCYGSGGSSRWNGQILTPFIYADDINPNYNTYDQIADTFMNANGIVLTGQIIDSAQPMYLVCGYDSLWVQNGVLDLPLEFTIIRKRIY